MWEKYRVEDRQWLVCGVKREESRYQECDERKYSIYVYYAKGIVETLPYPSHPLAIDNGTREVFLSSYSYLCEIILLGSFALILFFLLYFSVARLLDKTNGDSQTSAREQDRFSFIRIVSFTTGLDICRHKADLMKPPIFFCICLAAAVEKIVFSPPTKTWSNWIVSL